jgi:colanic acid/amylovoran biosynthesis glycosyltransferase
MRLALFLDSFPKISETFILNQVDGLLAQGHDITIFPRAASGETLLHPIVKRRRLLDSTCFPPRNARALRAKIDYYFRLVAVFLRHPKSVARLRSTFGEHGYISCWRAALAEAEPVIRHPGRFDVLFAHFGPNGLRANWYRAAGLLQGPLVTVFHGYDLTEYLRTRGAGVYAALLREGDLFLPISRFWREQLTVMGCAAERVKVHHVGIDCEQFSYHPRTLAPGRPVTLVSVARLVEKKGIEYALRALAQVVRHRTDIHYRIIGDGPLLAALEQLVAELHLGDYVTFTGLMTSDAVARELARAHIFLAPSVTGQSGDMEGIPTVLMEAMATGMPVISTRHSGIPELIESDVSGILVAERDIQGLAGAIRELIDDTTRWPAMAAAGREKVLTEFNSAVLNADLERDFEALCRARR